MLFFGVSVAFNAFKLRILFLGKKLKFDIVRAKHWVRSGSKDLNSVENIIHFVWKMGKSMSVARTNSSVRNVVKKTDAITPNVIEPNRNSVRRKFKINQKFANFHNNNESTIFQLKYIQIELWIHHKIT